MLLNKNQLIFQNFPNFSGFNLEIIKLFSFDKLIFLFIFFAVINEFGLREKVVCIVKKMYAKERKDYGKNDGCVYRGKALENQVNGVIIYRCTINSDKCPQGKGVYTSSLGRICYNRKGKR